MRWPVAVTVQCSWQKQVGNVSNCMQAGQGICTWPAAIVDTTLDSTKSRHQRHGRYHALSSEQIIHCTSTLESSKQSLFVRLHVCEELPCSSPPNSDDISLRTAAPKNSERWMWPGSTRSGVPGTHPVACRQRQPTTNRATSKSEPLPLLKSVMSRMSMPTFTAERESYIAHMQDARRL